jgi:hypothetical protein
VAKVIEVIAAALKHASEAPGGVPAGDDERLAASGVGHLESGVHFG